jgi:hypothetical protein
VGLPTDATRVLERFAASVSQLVAARSLYAGGSIASGDFHEGGSDFDLVALIEAPLDEARQSALRALHLSLMADEPLAIKLHCVYVPLTEVDDVAAAHLTWAHGELYGRPLSGVARAELLEVGVTVFGRPPGELVPPVSRSALSSAVRGELAGYWTDALGKPHLWLQDVYVDLGLLILPRAAATLREGRLITKREALTQLESFGVDPQWASEIARRRSGEQVPLSEEARQRRAEHALRVMDLGIRKLLAEARRPPTLDLA